MLLGGIYQGRVVSVSDISLLAANPNIEYHLAQLSATLSATARQLNSHLSAHQVGQSMMHSLVNKILIIVLVADRTLFIFPEIYRRPKLNWILYRSINGIFLFSFTVFPLKMRINIKRTKRVLKSLKRSCALKS